jgi:hypothetical protein
MEVVMPENVDTARSCVLQGYEIVLVLVRPVIPVLQILNSNFVEQKESSDSVG